VRGERCGPGRAARKFQKRISTDAVALRGSLKALKLA
jgi:hypothetical protein